MATPIRRYRPEQMRLLVHWSSQVYCDLDELKKSMDHSDDLTHDMVFERLLADMRDKGVRVAEPSRSVPRQRFHPGLHRDVLHRPDDTLGHAGRGLTIRFRNEEHRLSDLSATRLDGQVVIVTAAAVGASVWASPARFSMPARRSSPVPGRRWTSRRLRAGMGDSPAAAISTRT